MYLLRLNLLTTNGCITPITITIIISRLSVLLPTKGVNPHSNSSVILIFLLMLIIVCIINWILQCNALLLCLNLLLLLKLEFLMYLLGEMQVDFPSLIWDSIGILFLSHLWGNNFLLNLSLTVCAYRSMTRDRRNILDAIVLRLFGRYRRLSIEVISDRLH